MDSAAKIQTFSDMKEKNLKGGVEEGALGLGVETEMGVGDMAHGVAEVELGDVDVALDGAEEVDAEGPLVVADEVCPEPGFDGFFQLRGEACAGLDVGVGEEKVAAVDAGRGLEEGVADELEAVVLNAVEEGEIVGDLIAGLGDDAALLADDLRGPGDVVGSGVAGNPTEAATGAGPRGFEN